MHVSLPIQFSTFDQLVVSQGTVARLLMACAMGAIVGLEREWRHKASGLRTNMMVCMGAALFTVLSGFLAGPNSPNRGQVASNIVQGIGFLGAGLILHTRNRTVGMTSAATVWVVAAIGMACGAGLYLESLIATAIVFVSLTCIGFLESRSSLKRFVMLYEVRGTDQSRMFAAILHVLDAARLRLNIVERDNLGSIERVTFTIATSSVRHRKLLAQLIASDATDTVVAYRDEQED
ncbi:MAG: MgtC/SapB family protein [Acidobacteriota bacterium]|nr:MgtC/SapB family protein [Acidobacteriota bacterium]